MKMSKKFTHILLVLSMALFLFSGCGSSEESTAADPNASVPSLSGKTLQVFCGAGMTKPFTEIAQAFQDETGCTMEVVYANAAQSQTQIRTAEEGDLFVAGSKDELAPVEEYVKESVDLVKHIPVLAVQAGNPMNIAGLSDLATADVRVVLGDAEATPIGKIADKALKELGILDQIQILSRSTTAPEIINALSLDECDAVIVWKENATSSDAVEIVETTDLDPYVKTIPAASLTCSKDSETLSAFLDYLNSDEAKNIWQKYGYETLN